MNRQIDRRLKAAARELNEALKVVAGTSGDPAYFQSLLQAVNFIEGLRMVIRDREKPQSDR